VREVESRVDSAELSEWLAYWRIEPRWNPWVGLAHILQIIFNVNRGAKKPPRKLSDFLPRGMRRREQTTEQMRRAFAFFAAAHNGQSEG
jgi:hypothetical protein